MSLLTKMILSILSVALFINCETNAQDETPQTVENDAPSFINLVDFLQEHGPYEPITLKNLLETINESTPTLEILPKGNDIDPKCIFFLPKETAALHPVFEVLTEKISIPTRYDTYKTWRTTYQGKQIVEFNTYYHPTYKQLLELRIRTQE